MKAHLLLAAGSMMSLAVHAQSQKPNVVIFFTDDQGYADLNRYGSKDLVTPNIDKLCDEGIMFTQFYANASISSPSRAALMTGRYPHRAGLGDMASSAKGGYGMPSSEITIAEMLKTADYTTGIVGKWHLGYRPDIMPNNQGFDHAFGHIGGCIDNYSHFFYWDGPNRHDLWQNGVETYRSGENFSDLMVDEAKKFISENKNKPFFLYFASNYPHYPLQGDKKWREYYKNLPDQRANYAAMVSTIDEKIGMVIKKLEDEGVKDNTIIIFMSDNGYSTESRTGYGGGSAGNLRGAKFSCYEGGLRVPAIISFPKALPKNQVRDQVAMGADWFPTILDLCNISKPEVKLDGKSLLNIIKSDKEKTSHSVVNWEVYNSWAVRKGDYKLVAIDHMKNKTYSYELFNMVDDKNETCNLALTHPEIVQDLIKEHEIWKEDVTNNK